MFRISLLKNGLLVFFLSTFVGCGGCSDELLVGVHDAEVTPFDDQGVLDKSKDGDSQGSNKNTDAHFSDANGLDSEIFSDVAVSDSGNADLGINDAEISDLGSLVDASITDAGTDVGPDSSVDSGVERCPNRTPGWTVLARDFVHRSNGGPIDYLSLTIDQDDQPVIAFTQDPDQTIGPFGSNVYIYRHQEQGQDWNQVGSAINQFQGTFTQAYSPKIARNNNELFVLFAETNDGSTNRGYYLKRYRGTDWETYGENGIPLGVGFADPQGPNLMIDKSGNPVVAFHESNPSVIRIRRVFEQSVQRLEPSFDQFSSPNLGIDPDGRLVLIANDIQERIRRRNAADNGWESVGNGNVQIASQSSNLHLVSRANDGHLFAYFLESRNNKYFGFVQTWDGHSWTTLAENISYVVGSSSITPMDIALDLDGQPVIATVEQADGATPSLYLAHFNGQDLIPMSSSPLSNHAGTGTTLMADIEVDSCNDVVVAFLEYDGTRPSVQVLRYHQ